MATPNPRQPHGRPTATPNPRQPQGRPTATPRQTHGNPTSEPRQPQNGNPKTQDPPQTHGSTGDPRDEDPRQTQDPRLHHHRDQNRSPPRAGRINPHPDRKPTATPRSTHTQINPRPKTQAHPEQTEA
jgi:hypothetical protein